MHCERRAAWSGLLEKLRLEVLECPAAGVAATGAPCRWPRIDGAGHGLPRLAATSPCALPASATEQEFAANYSLHSLPIGVLTALAAPESPVSVEGLLEGGGELRRAADGTLSGQARLSSATGALSQGSGQDAMANRLPGFRARDESVTRNRASRGCTARSSIRVCSKVRSTSRCARVIRRWSARPASSFATSHRWRGGFRNWRRCVAVAHCPPMSAAPSAIRAWHSRVQARDLDAEVPLLGLHLKEGNVTATLRPDGSLEASGPSARETARYA